MFAVFYLAVALACVGIAAIVVAGVYFISNRTKDIKWTIDTDEKSKSQAKELPGQSEQSHS